MWTSHYGDYYRGFGLHGNSSCTFAVKSLEEGRRKVWYALKTPRYKSRGGFLFETNTDGKRSVWFFSTSAGAMEAAEAAEDGDFDWCGYNYPPPDNARRATEPADEDIEDEEAETVAFMTA